MGTVVRLWRRLWSSPPLTLNGWVAFNLPRTVTAVGVVLLVAIVVVHGYLAASQPALPTYFIVYAVVLAVGCIAAVVAVALTQWGWYLGSLVCVAFLGIYLVSRMVSLPGLEALTGRWDVAPGTFAMAFAAGFIAVHATVLSGINVAYPQQQGWHD